MKVPSKHIDRMFKREKSLLYGHSSELFRLEWVTSTGGTLNVPHDAYVGATEMIQVEADVSGIWGPVMRDQRERIDLDGLMVSIDQLGFVYFDNNLNLQGRDKLMILQNVTDKVYSGAGVGAASVWTPGTAPAWTVDEWITYWLIFSDRRFKITGNAVGDVTVDLNGGTLPTESTSAKIMRLIEWYPVRADLGVAAGAVSPINDQLIFQSIFVSRIPITGR